MSRSRERDLPTEAGPGPKGELFIVSAPSGTGKTTLIRRLFEQHGLGDRLAYSVSHTTRPRRPGEVDGRDYHFVDESTFRAMVEEGRFLEWAVVHGQLKGTSEAPLEAQLGAGYDVVLDIDVQGAEQVLGRRDDAQSIFILPPSYAELERRLRARSSEDEAQIARRLAESRDELRCYRNYRYVMINDEVARASEALAAVIIARRYRRHRLQHQIDRIMAEFPADAISPVPEKA